MSDLEMLVCTGELNKHPELLLQVAQSGKESLSQQKRLFGGSLSDSDLGSLKAKAIKRLCKLDEYRLNLEMLLVAIDTKKAFRAFDTAYHNDMRKIVGQMCQCKGCSGFTATPKVAF